jgi:hypothetical protein
MISWVMVAWNWFQLRHTIGGVVPKPFVDRRAQRRKTQASRAPLPTQASASFGAAGGGTTKPGIDRAELPTDILFHVLFTQGVNLMGPHNTALPLLGPVRRLISETHSLLSRANEAQAGWGDYITPLGNNRDFAPIWPNRSGLRIARIFYFTSYSNNMPKVRLDVHIRATLRPAFLRLCDQHSTRPGDPQRQHCRSQQRAILYDVFTSTGCMHGGGGGKGPGFGTGAWA